MPIFDKIEDVDLPVSLRPGITFRPYQKQGFNWLAFLHRFGLNGILADDMGLGKTLQTLAMLQRAKEQGGLKSPSLIICPTSVVSNWHAEAEKFFSNCPVILYVGNNRQAERKRIVASLKPSSKGPAGVLVVTSYDIARRDYKELKQIPWLYVVVDEGHNIKNPAAKRTKAIKAIPAQHKLAAPRARPSRTSWKSFGRSSTLPCPASWERKRRFATSTQIATKSIGTPFARGRAI